MDMSALLISVERARRENGAALPHARIRSDRGKWRMLRRLVRPLWQREDPPRKATVPAIRRIPRSRPAEPSEGR